MFIDKKDLKLILEMGDIAFSEGLLTEEQLRLVKQIIDSYPELIDISGSLYSLLNKARVEKIWEAE